MTTDENKQTAMRFIAGIHEPLATFASESFRECGRGIIQVTIPRLPKVAKGAAMATDMVYHALEDLRSLLGGMEGDQREDADITLRMIETYDPAKQAVVMVASETGNPITVKMKLELPSENESTTSDGDPEFFTAYKRFIDEHERCPDGPEHLKTNVWMPRESLKCSVTLTCICGVRVVLAASRTSGRAIVAAHRLNGIPVTESDGAEGVH